MKDEITKLLEDLKAKTNKDNIIQILHKELPMANNAKLIDFETDFSSVLFFKSIYDKTDTYYSNLINKIYSELSQFLTYIDQIITTKQREEQEEQ